MKIPVDEHIPLVTVHALGAAGHNAVPDFTTHRQSSFAGAMG